MDAWVWIVIAVAAAVVALAALWSATRSDEPDRAVEEAGERPETQNVTRLR